MVAEATGSTRFAGFATVTEIWASLPGFPTPRAIFGDVARCITLEPVQVPGDERPLFARVAAPTHAAVRFGGIDPATLAVNYPAAAGIEQDGTRQAVFAGDQPLYRFLDADGRPKPLHEVGIRPYYAPLFGGDVLLRPRLGDEAIGPPSEFLTLWALLFCLSELARYYPDTWILALDPDRSPAATTLEHGLDLALDRAPALIGEALRGSIDELVREELRDRRAEAAAALGEEPAVEDEGGAW